MITAMNLLTLLITAIAGAAVLAFAAHALVLAVKNDGYGRPGLRTPPRSHEPDPFDPQFPIYGRTA